jgi:hypothetical protein
VALPFFVKMALVLTSVATLIPLRKLVAQGDLSESEAGRARTIAIVSIFAWAGAVTAGRLLAYLVVT